MNVTLTVFFEDPFWVGFLERRESEKLSVARVVFGAEPTDVQVYGWVLSELYKVKYSAPVADAKLPKAADNPKRRRRQAAKAVSQGIGTKSQQALQQAREDSKLERNSISKQQRELDEERLFQQRMDKKKEKHRGH